MTFDLDLWPTDLKINRDHLLTKDYLPTKFEASWAKRSWVISCTRWSKLAWPLTLTLTYWPELDRWPTDLKINRDHLLTKDYLPTKFEVSGAKLSWVISCTRWSKLAWPLTFDLLTWKSIGIIYSPRTIYCTKFEASGAKRSWVISCTRWSKLAWPLTLTFDLLTWKSIGIIYSPKTIYLPSFKLLGQSVLELSVAQGEVNWHDLWPWPLTYWPESQ